MPASGERLDPLDTMPFGSSLVIILIALSETDNADRFCNDWVRCGRLQRNQRLMAGSVKIKWRRSSNQNHREREGRRSREGIGGFIYQYFSMSINFFCALSYTAIGGLTPETGQRSPTLPSVSYNYVRSESAGSTSTI